MAATLLDPNLLLAYEVLGNACLRQGQVDAALAEFQRALDLDPASAEAHYNLGNTLLQKGRMDDAIFHFQQAVNFDPGYADAHGNLGSAYWQQGRLGSPGRRLASLPSCRAPQPGRQNCAGQPRARPGLAPFRAGSQVIPAAFSRSWQISSGFSAPRRNRAIVEPFPLRMNRPCVLALLAVLALPGCNRAPNLDSANSVPPSDASDLGTTTPSGTDQPVTFTPPRGQLVTSSQVPLLEQINREYEKVAAAATPCIVCITSMSQIDPHSQLFGDLPFKIPGLPHGVHPSVPSYGSGVIISRDGYIVTNQHVIADTLSVEVQLHDQRTFPARIVAADDESDLAVLKIAATDLPALPWGNSDKVQVGEQVFAIGNPFDLADSVSRGIVSAKGRNLPDSTTYEDYIQTDAAINMGNSGGALVNIHGELIGINTAIASFSRGSEGVGFSIPSNTVRLVVDGLLKSGSRGYLGVQLPSKVDDGVVELLGLGTDHGALLAGVFSKSPADLANLRPADLVTEVDGHAVSGSAQLRMIVAQVPVGKEIEVRYIRAGSSHTTHVKIAGLPRDIPGSGSSTSSYPDPGVNQVVPASLSPAASHVLAGLQVVDLTDKTRSKFGVEDIVTSGVVVTNVQEGSPADSRGLLRGDVIDLVCAQRGFVQPLNNAVEFNGVTHSLKSDQSVVLLIHHGRLAGQEDKSSMFVYLAPQK